MIRYKKIRGHKRIWRDIDDWIDQNKKLDLDDIQQRQRDYTKVWITPFSNINVLNSKFSTPKGKTRKKVIAGIYEIYSNWKIQLETLNKPYYLKIWFFPNDVSKCQVVCAIDDFIHFYDKTFYNPKVEKKFPELNDLKLEWEYRHQEHHITKEDIGEPDDFLTFEDYLENKNYIENFMKNPNARITNYTNEAKETTTYYSIKECDVWIGG